MAIVERLLMAIPAWCSSRDDLPDLRFWSHGEVMVGAALTPADAERTAVVTCDHKFIDSRACLRCGVTASSLLAESKAAALFSARVVLCDLLIGRRLRGQAQVFFDSALLVERQGVPPELVTELLAAAAHWEWIASISEQGQVFWGNRHNRCGSVEDVDLPLDVFSQSFDSKSPE